MAFTRWLAGFAFSAATRWNKTMTLPLEEARSLHVKSRFREVPPFENRFYLRRVAFSSSRLLHSAMAYSAHFSIHVTLGRASKLST